MIENYDCGNYEGKMPKSGTDYRGKVVEIILDALN